MMVSPHSFLTTESDYPGLNAVLARLSFPNPFELGDYVTWFHALEMRRELETDDVDNDALIREYRAAMAVATLEAIEPDADADEETAVPDENSDSFNLSDVDPDDEELPMAFLTWVTDCADRCFGRQLIIEPLQATLARRQASTHTSAVFRTEQTLSLFPDLVAFPGIISFKGPFTKKAYRQWNKARRILPKYDPRDVENSVFLRQWRAAVTLIDKWDVDGVPWQLVKRNDGYGVPLVVASWVVEAADTYLSKRINLKKMLGM